MVYLPVGAGVPEHNQYKVFAAVHRKPEIVVVGSSRVTAFRREMFARQPEAFYNAATLASVPETVALLVSHLPTDPPPRILMLGIDPDFFNANAAYAPLERLPSSADFQPVEVVRSAIKRFFRRRIPLLSILNRADRGYGWPALGLAAMDMGEGFRGDGSYRFSMLHENPDLTLTLMDIPQGASQPNPVRLAAYDRILTWATEHNIYVIGVVTPYGAGYYDLIQNSPDHTFFPQARAQIAVMFAEYGFPYYDFADLVAVGWSMGEMRDIVHMSDLLAARVILEIARQEPRLSTYVDVEQLEHDIAQAPNPDNLYDRLPIITPPEADQP
ncbi:MAG: hypothetical protein MUF38_06245 [Anaerolineae bacterium]|nr:hypothetical protein [Anaerolineae bacterium]